LLGAIAGDIIGSPYEARNCKRTDFPLFRWDATFTDDTVLTVAVADTLLNAGDYVERFKEYYHRYPNRGFGAKFIRWARSNDPNPYQSWGNGSAMRASPVGFAFGTLEEVLAEAKRSAEVTHDHPDGIAGAQATAAAVFLARTGRGKAEIRDYVETTFGYRMDRTLDELRPTYRFDPSCRGTVPVAVTAFVESQDWEDAVRKAVSVGGDSDTIACITGGIAQAFYGGVPEEIAAQALEHLDDALRAVVTEFSARYRCG
jgi:ADP-ribosylglycohydrolase